MSMLFSILAAEAFVALKPLPFSCQLVDEGGRVSLLAGVAEVMDAPPNGAVGRSASVKITNDGGNLFLLFPLPGQMPAIEGTFDGRSYSFGQKFEGPNVTLTPELSSNTGYALVSYWTAGVHMDGGHLSVARAGPCNIGPRAK